MNPGPPPNDFLAALERLELTQAALRMRLRQRLRVSNTDIIAIQLIDQAGTRGLIAPDLASLLNLSAPAVTALTKRLEAQGFIAEEHSSGYRRARQFHVSDTARIELLDAMTATRETLQGIVDELSDIERHRTVAILNRVTDALDGGAPATVTATAPEKNG